MSAQQGAPNFATQMATFTQQLTALQSKVATLWRGRRPAWQRHGSLARARRQRQSQWQCIGGSVVEVAAAVAVLRRQLAWRRRRQLGRSSFLAAMAARWEAQWQRGGSNCKLGSNMT
jgi:hypothetical protein